MLETELEMDQEGMTVPYPPLFDHIRRNHGFTDLRGRPDLAAGIVESAGSRAMTDLLVALARPGSKLFTVGCDLGIKESDDEAPNTAGGYIQIMSSEYARRTPDDYARFAQAVAEMLKAKSEDEDWEVRFILRPVRFKLDNFSEMTGSLWIWFHAFADTKHKTLISRENLIGEIKRAFFDDSNLVLFEKEI